MRPHLLLVLFGALWSCDDTRSRAPADAEPDLATLDAGLPDGAPPDGAVVDALPTADGRLPDAAQADGALPGPPVIISELMAANDGAWVDEVGETDDWVELWNRSDAPVSLLGWRLADGRGDGFPLPDILLSPGAVVVLWADDEREQGPYHLPFKLSSEGETLSLWGPGRTLADRVEFGPSRDNEAWARFGEEWEACRWPTPDRPNPERCGSAPPPDGGEEITFEPYEWSSPWPYPPEPLVVTELSLRPAPGATAFIEVLAVGPEAVPLDGYELRVSPHRPGEPWPTAGDGHPAAWPVGSLAPDERVEVPVPEEALAELAENEFEGVVSLWSNQRVHPVDRVDFMAWPDGASLARQPDATGRHRFCSIATPGAANDGCEPLSSRRVGERLRHLRTPGDFAALAEGGTALGVASVKWVLDLEAGGPVHLLSTRDWDLHYTFVRERIEMQPHLDRCDPTESALFVAGWRAFSDINYLDVEGRRYLLGTLVHHGGPDLHTAEYAPGDRIVASQMRRGFFGVMAHVEQPTRFSLRPQSARQVSILREIEGDAPIVGPEAPFRGLTYQALTATVGYGVLTWVPLDELEDAALGPQVIVLTDQVPNDIALTGGLITEAFQTPLAHVNLLSRNRNTPNMALPNAREDARVAPLLGRLVRLEVAGAGFELREAEPAVAEAFWAARRPSGEPVRPRLDDAVRGLQSLADHGLEGLPGIGAKAAQLAELARVVSAREDCAGGLPLPAAPAAIPLVHGLEHFVASGAAAWLARLQADPEFRNNPRQRAMGLEQVRAMVLAHPVPPELVSEVLAWADTHWPGERIRFRSSSNTEDLPGFNGAGLYTSVGVEPEDRAAGIEDAIRTVWASLWRPRAYDERDYHNIAQDGVAMGVLIHPAFPSERANGVGISRNVLEPIRNQYYLNVQVGEASVTNPAPGVGTEQILFDFTRTPRIRYVGRSTLTGGQPVLAGHEINAIACTLRAIHDHFRPLIDPGAEDRWFAMDIEFKLVGAERALLIKQARPYSFGAAEIPADCREL